MRYFTKELWVKANDINNNLRAQAEKEWNANCLLYQQQFAEVKKHLSHSFVENFITRSGLHDYIFLSISTIKRGREYTCEIQLTNGSESILLTMFGLRLFHINVESFQYCIQGRLTWGYSEFDTTSDGSIRLSILCDVQNEMNFEFQSIKFIKQ